MFVCHYAGKSTNVFQQIRAKKEKFQNLTILEEQEEKTEENFSKF